MVDITKDTKRRESTLTLYAHQYIPLERVRSYYVLTEEEFLEEFGNYRKEEFIVHDIGTYLMYDLRSTGERFSVFATQEEVDKRVAEYKRRQPPKQRRKKREAASQETSEASQ